MESYNELKQQIDFWCEWSINDTSGRFDIALFKIWVKFEKFLSIVFVNYSLQISLHGSYRPRLKITFQNEEQFNAFLRDGSKRYIEYYKKIKNLSKFIFEDNPFAILYEDIEISDVVSKVIAVRNYVAHESEESKSKYVNECLNGKPFIDPNDYLRELKEEQNVSNFTSFIDSIKFAADHIMFGKNC